MSLRDRADHLRVELREIRATMRGINPKMETYRILNKKAEAIEVELTKIGAERTKR